MSIKIVLISDNHFSANNELLFNQYDVEKNIALLDELINQENPDYIFALGDISQDGSAKSYEKARKQFETYNKPIYYIPGNHDNPANINNLDSDLIKSVKYLDIARHRFIFLDSSVKNTDSGFLSPAQLESIRLNYNKELINHLVLHHHFVPLNSIIDNFILTNASELIAVIKALHITNIFTGHVHNGISKNYDGLDIHHCPASCVQFGLTKELQLENIIGYRIINLDKDLLFTYSKLLQI